MQEDRAAPAPVVVRSLLPRPQLGSSCLPSETSPTPHILCLECIFSIWNFIPNGKYLISICEAPIPMTSAQHGKYLCFSIQDRSPGGELAVQPGGKLLAKHCTFFWTLINPRNLRPSPHQGPAVGLGDDITRVRRPASTCGFVFQSCRAWSWHTPLQPLHRNTVAASPVLRTHFLARQPWEAVSLSDPRFPLL